METKNDIVGIRQEKQIVPIAFMIEIDGDWYHGNKEVLGEKKLNKMQLRNKVVDAIKDKWCAIHHIPILRLWENDVRKNPKKIFDELNAFIDEAKRQRRILETKQKPH
jgi:very-short-patch-repair endonuclease